MTAIQKWSFTNAGFMSKWLIHLKLFVVFLCFSTIFSCALTLNSDSSQATQKFSTTAVSPANVDDLMIVDCLLPGQIKRLGQMAVYVGQRRPIKTTAVDCAIRGGEYVAYDRSNYETARKVWTSAAEQDDKNAQNYLGEIYEKGLGTKPDYTTAAKWYQRAAEQGHTSAQVNLGKLFELGLGVSKDIDKAFYWYRRAAGLPELKLDPRLQLVMDAQEGTKPIIQILDPFTPRTRGVVLVSIKELGTKRRLKGRVVSPIGLSRLTVNNKDTPTDKEGYFELLVNVKKSGSKITIVAIDKKEQRAERSIVLRPAKPAPSLTEFGKYYALVIGNNKYKYLNSLDTAEYDAKTVSTLLESKYGFKVTPLYNATRYEILTALNHLLKNLTEKDNFLLYYAGHGHLDEANIRGHWLPVDAEMDNTSNWISNVSITDLLNKMSARHILVIADSCYSGTLTRSTLMQLRPGYTDEYRNTYIKTVLKKRSRTALTSGGLQPVLDVGGGNHSVFAKAFIDVLNENLAILEGQQLYLEVVARVTHAAFNKRFEQIPQYAPIKFAGHEAGDFFFIPVN